MVLTVKVLKNMSHLIYSYYDDTYDYKTVKVCMYHYSVNNTTATTYGSGTYWVTIGSIEL